MKLAQKLSEVLGSDATLTDPSTLSELSNDYSTRGLIQQRMQRAIKAAAAVRPTTTEDVSKLLAWADTHKVGVIPRGGGSGVVEAIAGRDAVIVDLSALNRIVDWDEKSRLVTVQAGVSGPQLQEYLSTRGFTLGHEPQSITISSAGGWVATRATGQLSAFYGGIENLVAGIEAVLPGGHIVKSKPSPRRSTGPDVAALMIGSEGTLGIITEIVFRATLAPVHRNDASFVFEHMADGVAACRALAQSHRRPALVRLYDREDVLIAFRDQPEPPDGCVLLLSFFEEPGELTFPNARRGETRWVERWWEHRNDVVADYKPLMLGHGILGPHPLVDTMEVSGTWTVLRDLYHEMKDALTPKADIVGCHLSHVYPDGACLYFTLASACSSDEEALTRYDDWWETGMTTCLRSGGSISHHHGIGRLKASWLPQEIGEWFEVLRAVKRAIDPNGIMNPGALGL